MIKKIRAKVLWCVLDLIGVILFGVVSRVSYSVYGYESVVVGLLSIIAYYAIVGARKSQGIKYD